ncbi:MAG: DUF4160 domain-containing protein [Pseudomonadota bacterium]
MAKALRERAPADPVPNGPLAPQTRERPQARTRPMPTVLRIGPFRFFFYSGDGGEPPHIHVERDGTIARFWQMPVRLASGGGFKDGGVARDRATRRRP